MSTSSPATDFDRWLAGAFAEDGAFTALIVLVDIAGVKVTPLRSTYLNVIGDEVGWSELVGLFASAGVTWNAVAFFPETADDGGPLEDEVAKGRLRLLEERLSADRLVLNEGHFFDIWGRRLKVEEVELQ